MRQFPNSMPCPYPNASIQNHAILPPRDIYLIALLFPKPRRRCAGTIELRRGLATERVFNPPRCQVQRAQDAAASFAGAAGWQLGCARVRAAYCGISMASASRGGRVVAAALVVVFVGTWCRACERMCWQQLRRSRCWRGELRLRTCRHLEWWSCDLRLPPQPAQL
jgi:hypothetical protein